MHQRNIAQAPDRRDTILWLRRDKDDIAKIPFCNVCDQPVAGRTRSGKDKNCLFRVFEERCCIDHVFKPVRHAMRADIADGKAVLEVPLAGQRGIAFARRIARQIDSIDNDRDFFRGDTPSHQISLEGVGQRDNAGGAAIQKQFQRLNQPQGWSRSHGADRRNRGRP